MKLKLMEEMDTLIPQSLDFQSGYYSGKQSKKHWLINDADLKDMYHAHDSRQSVFLWCDRADEQISTAKRTKTLPSQVPSAKSRKVDTDEELEETVERIRAIHGHKYSYSQYRIWARLVLSGMFKNITVAPPIPAIQGTAQPSKRTQESLKDVIAGAAVTFVNAMRSPDCSTSGVKAQNSVVINSQVSPTKDNQSNTSAGISPCRATDLRMKKLQELRELQNLLESKILNDEEFLEQKAIVLQSLRKLKQ